MTNEHWGVVDASETGKSHLRSGTPCQDAHYHKVIDRVLVVAVGDGAGSADLSQVGSHLATQEAVEEFSRLFLSQGSPGDDAQWRDTLEGCFRAALEALRREAHARKLQIKELATTLLLAVATPDTVVGMQVGDGAIVAEDPFGEIFALTVPQVGEYANETTFLSSPSALDEIQFQVHRGIVRSLAVFSDGLQWLAFNMKTSTPHKPFFAPIFELLREASPEEAFAEIEELLRSPRVTERTDDDLTIVLASRVGGGNHATHTAVDW